MKKTLLSLFAFVAVSIIAIAAGSAGQTVEESSEARAGDGTVQSLEYVFNGTGAYAYKGDSPQATFPNNIESTGLLSGPQDDFTLSFGEYYLKPGNDGTLTWAYIGKCTVSTFEAVTITEIRFGFGKVGNTSTTAETFWDAVTASENNKNFKMEGNEVVWKGSVSGDNCLSFTSIENNLTDIQYILVKYDKQPVVVEAPQISLASGNVLNGARVTISADSKYDIMYSLSNNGTENWQTYGSSLRLAEAGTWTLKAKAIYHGYESEVVSAVYNVAEPSENGYKGVNVNISGVTFDEPFTEISFFNKELLTVTQFNVDNVAKLSWGSGMVQANSQLTTVTIKKGATLTFTPEDGLTITRVGFYFNKNQVKNGKIADVSQGEMSTGGLSKTDKYSIVFEWLGAAADPFTVTFLDDTNRSLYGLVVEYSNGSVQGYVNAPKISPKEGNYEIGQLVEITADEGSTIMYSATTDGSENYKTYTEPFALDAAGTWTVKAKAVKDDAESKVVTAVYNVAAPIVGATEPGGAILKAISKFAPAGIDYDSQDINVFGRFASVDGAVDINWTPALDTDWYAYGAINILLNTEFSFAPAEGVIIRKVRFYFDANAFNDKSLGNVCATSTGGEVLGLQKTETGTKYYCVEWTGKESMPFKITFNKQQVDYLFGMVVDYEKVIEQPEPAVEAGGAKLNVIDSFAPAGIDYDSQDINVFGQYAGVSGVADINWTPSLDTDWYVYGAVNIKKNTEFSIAPVDGVTVRKVRFYFDANAFNDKSLGIICATSTVGEVLGLQKTETGTKYYYVEWTGKENMPFTITFNQQQVDYLFGMVVEYEKVVEPEGEIVVAFGENEYTDGQSIVASLNDVITVTAPESYEQISWIRKDADGQNETEAQVADGNTVDVKLDTLGSYVYTFTATRNNGKDVIVASFNIDVQVVDAVDGVMVDEAAAEYFNMNGQRVADKQLQPGIYVKRVGGKTTKIMVK